MANSGERGVDATDRARRDLRTVLPELRGRCESSRSVPERTTERARRAIETARAMRSLLPSHGDGPPGQSPALPEIWEAAARGIVRIARERDRGLGIGLALAKIVELHGGTRAARSGGRGRGSVFVVQWPLASRP